MSTTTERSIAQDAAEIISSMLSAKIEGGLTVSTDTARLRWQKGRRRTEAGRRPLLSSEEKAVLTEHYCHRYSNSRCRAGHDLADPENVSFFVDYRSDGRAMVRRRCMCCHRERMGLDPFKGNAWTPERRAEHARKYLVPLAKGRTHCKRGHDLRIPENVRLFKAGGKQCLICQRKRSGYQGLTKEQLADISRKNLKKAQASKRAYCRKGEHSLDPSSGNVYTDKHGKRLCLKCRAAYKREWYQDNIEKARERGRRYEARRRQDPEYRRKMAEYMKVWRQKRGPKVKVIKQVRVAMAPREEDIGTYRRYQAMILEYFRATSYTARRDVDGLRPSEVVFK